MPKTVIVAPVVPSSDVAKSTKHPGSVDLHVGHKIRDRRKELRLSQTDLGRKVGVSFQQVQKYENGTNRVGASRLAAIARALGVPVAYFFPVDEPQKLRRSISLRSSLTSRHASSVSANSCWSPAAHTRMVVAAPSECATCRKPCRRNRAAPRGPEKLELGRPSPPGVARKSKEMAPNSKEPRVGMAYITANRIPAGEQPPLKPRPPAGVREGGAGWESSVPPSHASNQATKWKRKNVQ